MANGTENDAIIFGKGSNGTEVSVRMHRSEEDDSNTRLEYLPLFDSRLYRKIELFVPYNDKGKDTLRREGGGWIYPHFDYNNYVLDYQETVSAIQQEIDNLKSGDASANAKSIAALEEKQKGVADFIQQHYEKSWAPHSFIHPYALVKLTGAYGYFSGSMAQSVTYDRYNHRKWYETEGDEYGGYSRTPTTTAIIRWGNDDSLGRTPYSFQDFVFCKHWNKIENNRLITLRRYAAPVLDDLSFSDFVLDVLKTTEETIPSGKKGEPDTKITKVTEVSGSKPNRPWSPLATAVTYFGEGTENTLSSLLAFSANYRWKLENRNEQHPTDITSAQQEGGTGFVNESMGALTSGLNIISKVTGVLGQLGGKNSINWEAAPKNLPPDPYKDGPYENRILGPINVITNTYRRERGLEFKNEGLKIKFDYVARPIAGINSKAILLDLLSNILTLTYSQGSWFGGMWRYNNDKPEVYPFRYGDSMNKLYRGELFGENGAIMTLKKDAWEDTKNGIGSVIPDIFSTMKNLAKGAFDAVMGYLTGDNDRKKMSTEEFKAAYTGNVGRTVSRLLANKALAGATIPYIKNQRALLTGDPVGDWHLTIGNPLNPIAMIGNLICKNVEIKFYDEFGPDDFPIGFTATVTLDHGIGRDREAIESMFNRGKGRIYSLPATFKSSADGETKIDRYTGTNGEERKGYDETRNTYFGGGTRFIAAVGKERNKMAGTVWDGSLLNYTSLVAPETLSERTESTYVLTPWQMGSVL